MDPQIAERATSRRGWLGAAGAAGLLGAAAVLLSDGPATAAPPNSPTDADKDLLGAAQSLELAARDLYQLAIDAGIDDPDGGIGVMARNHRAYAESIAGMTGISANTPNQEVFDALESDFDTTDVQQFAAAAQQLENDAVATHTELLTRYESLQAKRLTASILVVEARQATVLGDVVGDEVDALLDASGTAASTTAAADGAEGDA